MTVDTIKSAAIELRASVERLAADDASGQGAFRDLIARARALGARWACLAEADRMSSQEVASLFDPWLDLEVAFLAGVADVVREETWSHGADRLEEQIASEVLQEQKDRLAAVIPGLVGWCSTHLRASHHGGSVLFTCAEGDALVDAVSLIVREDAEIDWAEPGPCGPFRVSLPRRGWFAEGMHLLDAIEAVRCRLAQETSDESIHRNPC